MIYLIDSSWLENVYHFDKYRAQLIVYILRYKLKNKYLNTNNFLFAHYEILKEMNL